MSICVLNNAMLHFVSYSDSYLRKGLTENSLQGGQAVSVQNVYHLSLSEPQAGGSLSCDQVEPMADSRDKSKMRRRVSSTPAESSVSRCT